jgi:uncharacterized protein YecE (DUF72 family)
VPPGFFFCPKISRYITQMKKLNDPEETLPSFFSLFSSMKRRLGPVLIQLPPSLAFHAEKAEHFFRALKRGYQGYRFSLEVRHDSWLQPGAAGLMEKFGIGFVIAESGSRFPYAEFITAPHIYLRFHGPDGSYASSYSERKLQAYAAKCKAWAAQGHALWIFFNNDGNAYAVQNANRLKTVLGSE